MMERPPIDLIACSHAAKLARENGYLLIVLAQHATEPYPKPRVLEITFKSEGAREEAMRALRPGVPITGKRRSDSQ